MKSTTPLFLLLALHLAAPSFAEAIGRMYICEGDNLELTLQQDFETNRFDLTIETVGLSNFDGEIDLQAPHITEHAERIEVSVASSLGAFFFSVAKPLGSAIRKDIQGQFAYEEKTKTIVSFYFNHKLATYQLECNAYDLDENFFDDVCLDF